MTTTRTARTSFDPLARLEWRERFAAAVLRPDNRIDLGEAALLVAAEEYPDLDLHVYTARLESLADRVDRVLGKRPGPLAALNALRAVLVHREGFKGDEEDYYDPRNSFLSDVLERRKGIPITLSVVWLEVARRVGLPLEGVNMPAHFLVRLLDPAGSLLIDPFHDGEVITTEECARRLETTVVDDTTLSEEHLTSVGPKQILVRMLNNLRLIYMRREEYARALAAVDRIALITGDTPGLRRDRGLLFSKLHLYGKAWADLAASLERAPIAAPDTPESGRAELLREHLERVQLLAAGRN